MYVIFLFSFLFLLDFGLKEYSSKYLKWNGQINYFNNFLQIIYVENKGIAFNLLENKKRLILISNFLLLSYILYLYFTSENSKIPLVLIFSGGFGNFFDRFIRGYVIDYIYFNLKKFPVFNLSDFYIIIGAILFAF